MASLLARIARSASHRWRRSLALAALFFVTLGALAGTLGGTFSDEFSVPGTESQQAMDLLEQRFPAAAHEGATVVFHTDDGTLRDGSRTQAIDEARREIARLPDVASVSRPQVSQDGTVAFATIQYDRPAFEIDQDDAQRLATVADVAVGGGLEVDLRGP